MSTIIDEIMAEHEVEEIGKHKFRVFGKNYTIRFCGRGDGVAKLWHCNCPAGSYGKTCKHIKQVATANNAVCSTLGLD